MRVWQPFLVGILFIHSVCSAMPSEPLTEKMTVDADHVEYNGRDALLQGNVTLEHELGILKAEQASLENVQNSKSFGLLHLNGQVQVTFNGGGVLSCAWADIDCKKMEGLFFGGSDSKVVYADKYTTNKDANVPLSVTSNKMSAQLGKKSIQNKLRYDVGVITAEGDVVVEYSQEFIAEGGYALYRRFTEELAPNKLFQGSLTLQKDVVGSSDEGICQVKSLDGSLIRGSHISINTATKELHVDHPQGMLKDTKGEIHFTSSELLWDEGKGILTLSDQVEIDQPGIGKLTTTETVRLTRSAESGKQLLKLVETDGDSLLTYKDQDNSYSHILKCVGTITVDHQKMETRMYAQKDAQGHVKEEDQILFKDEKGEIHADRAFLAYTYENKQLVPTKIILVGNVRISNSLAALEADKPVVSQYVLADRVEFFPRNKQMLLKASRGKRVLFFDKTNALEVSAPAINIIRDHGSNKETIKGIGDVRFNFVEGEFAELQKKFSLNKFK